ITIDPSTGSGTGLLLLHNETRSPKRVSLTATGKELNNSIAIVEFASEPPVAFARLFEMDLAPKQTVSVRIRIVNDWDDGDLNIQLTNHFGSELLGIVQVRRRPVGLRLLQGDQFKLALVDGLPTRIALRS